MKSHVFHRHTGNNFPTAVTADGCYITDASGKRYIDGSGGAAISCLGHGDITIIEAIKEQAAELAFAHTSFFTSEPAEQLATILIDNAPKNLDRVYFVSGGSEAIEASLKLARQYFVEKGEMQRRHLISRRQSYHGNTLGALAVGGNQSRREKFYPLLFDVTHISPCYEYANRFAHETSFEYGQRVAEELEDEILRIGQDKVMAFVAEPVVGATLGAVTAVNGYFRRIREICNKYGVLLIFDEVMCGMGRTGYFFASEVELVSPDILCIAKGLGAGYQPIGAMLCSKEIYKVLEDGSGFFQHGHSYLGHPVATAAALAVVKKLLSCDLINRSKLMGSRLKNKLITRLGDNPNVGDIRGRGLFVGIELVKNQDTKVPFDNKFGLANQIKKTSFDAGLICYPMSGTRDGKNGDHVLLAPPFVVENEHINEIVEKISFGIDEAIGRINNI